MPTKPVLLTQVSFTGMSDSLDPSTADPRKASLLQNCFPSDTFEGAATVGRPGFQQSGTVLVTGAKVTGLCQYTKLDGTEKTVGFVNGLMYVFNWTTRAWSNVVLGGGAVLSTTNPIYGINFANVLVVSDGIHTPFQWDGTTFTVLANCPVLYGPPTIYYDKLFGIKNAARTTFVWSEENDPTTGYEAGGFNNAWQLGQTSQDALTALLGTNDALFYFRARSSGYISGAVNADFKASGTREGVDETIGTVSPSAVVYYERRIYFLSADGRPYVITLGGGLNDKIWQDLRETLATVARGSLALSLAVADPLSQMVLLGIPTQAQTVPTTFIALDSRTQNIGGLWTGFQPTAMAMVKDDNLVPRIMHGTANGYVYDHGDPNGTLWQDENSPADGGTLAIAHTVTGSPMGFDLKYEKVFDRIDLSLRLNTNMSYVTVDYTTPRGAQELTSGGLTTTWDATNPTWDSSTPVWDTSRTFSFIGVGKLWDVATWDSDTWSVVELESHVAIGWRGRGRWIMPSISHGYTSERFGLIGWSITTFPDAGDPRIP